MGRLLLSSLAASLFATAGWAQPESRSVLGQENQLLAEGATAMRAGRYEDGIRLTIRGLESESTSITVRAGALANLCAAYAAKGDPDTAIGHCDASLAINTRNWRAYSNRAFAYWLKGMYAEAALDIEAASAIAPDARQVREIRGLINERRLEPRVTMEDPR
jgi:tetratricopeptide (TPR) repeat protein